MYAATDAHPRGFDSVSAAFRWPDLFLERLEARYGKDFLVRRLRSWAWTSSSCFSGVGAPESVLSSAHHAVTQRALQFEALHSLQRAAQRYLARNGPGENTRKNVKFGWTCEIDKGCQKVLRSSYGDCCNWPNVLELKTKKKSLYCSTHKKLCPYRQRRAKRRALTASFALQLAHLGMRVNIAGLGLRSSRSCLERLRTSLHFVFENGQRPPDI